MPLTISEDHKAHLSLLIPQEAPVVGEFCRLAIQFLKQGVNPRVFNSAANKLKVQPNEIEEAIRALVYLLSHCTQATASKDEFNQLLLSLGFSEDAAQVLTETFTQNEPELKMYLKKMGVQVPEYCNLEWRFDILVGSRTLNHIAEPLITMQLSLDSHKSKEDGSLQDQPGKLLLQTDPNNLSHMTAVLEEALHEARTHHSRKIHRHLK